MSVAQMRCLTGYLHRLAARARLRRFSVFMLCCWEAAAGFSAPVPAGAQTAASQLAGAVITSTTAASAGIAVPGGASQAGFDQQIDLSGRARIGALRLSVQVSANVSAGFAAAVRWLSYSAVQTLRWNWPAWSASAAAPNFLAALEIQELAAAVSGELAGVGLRAELGKFPLKWGVGKAFRPSDIFRTMDYSALIPQAGGTPAVRLSAFPSALSRIEAVAAIDGQGALTAGARYLTSIGEVGALAASAGWRRASGVADELSASLEGQIDVGIFSPYTEISVRSSGSKFYAYAMLGSGATIGDITLYAECQGTFGLSTSDLRFFGLATWKLSELTTISLPLFWLNDARTASGGLLAQFEGIFGGRLDFAASGGLICSLSPAAVVWKLSASWTRSLSTY